MGGRERPQQIITDPYSEYEPVYANCRNYKLPRTSHGGFASVSNFRASRCKMYLMARVQLYLLEPGVYFINFARNGALLCFETSG